MTTPTAIQTKAEHTDSLILRELANGPRSVTDLCIAINHTDTSDSKRVGNRLQDLKQRDSVGLFGRRWHLLDSKGKPVHPPEATIPGAMKVTRVPVVGAAKAAAPSNGTRGVPSGTPIVPPAPPPPPTKSPDVSERERAEAATRLENAEARKYLRGGLLAVLDALGRRPAGELLDDELVDRAKRAVAERNVALASAEAAMTSLRSIARDVGAQDADDLTGIMLASRVINAIQDLRQEGDEADRLLKQRTAERDAALKRVGEVEALQAELASANKEADDLRVTLTDVCLEPDGRAELAAVYRQLGISDPPPTAEERDRVIAELRTAAVEASSLRAKLQTAQDVIKRLEADVQRAQAEAGSHPTEAPPWTPPDRVVGNLFSDLAESALAAIGAGEDHGAELAVLALRTLHQAQLELQSLRHHHDAMLGFEVSHG
jgi:hypothetical protein